MNRVHSRRAEMLSNLCGDDIENRQRRRRKYKLVNWNDDAKNCFINNSESMNVKFEVLELPPIDQAWLFRDTFCTTIHDQLLLRRQISSD